MEIWCRKQESEQLQQQTLNYGSEWEVRGNLQ